MIWSDFQDEVRTLLTVDAQRKGAGIQSYIDSIILSGVIELQQYIPSLRSFNRDTFYHDQLKADKDLELSGVVMGKTQGRGKITKATVLKPQDEKVIAINLNRWSWDKRTSLAMGCLSDCRSARHPGKIMECKKHINSFYLYPALSEDELLIIDWEGVKTRFGSEDETPYDHRVVKVISDYAKAHIVREVDKDLQLYTEYYGTYIKERSVLYLDEKDTSLFDLPAVSEDHYSNCCLSTDTMNRLVAKPEAPDFFDFIVTPDFMPTDLEFVGLVPSAPTNISAPDQVLGLYGQSISNSATQIPAQPTSLIGSLVGSADDFYMLKPTGLSSVVGVSSPPTGLEAIIKPFAPTSLSSLIATAPQRPTQLYFAGFVPDAPTQLVVNPDAPTGLAGVVTGNDALLPPEAPHSLRVYPLAPTELEGLLSNATGTVVQPTAPTGMEGVHDGTGGEWYPEEPTQLLAEVLLQAPNAPTGLSDIVSKYLLVRYEFDGTNFVRKEYYLMEIDLNDGGSILINDFQ
tara:strand:- start:8013 stop:9557 length:1545 start_codon:yes stop_codon:yes gene_type:complete